MYTNPLQLGAAFSKQDILQDHKRASSDTWTGLANSMWINKALKDMPEDHPSSAEMLRRPKENRRFSPELTGSKAGFSPGSNNLCKPEVLAIKPYDVTHEKSVRQEYEAAQKTSHDAVPASMKGIPAPGILDDCVNDTKTFDFDLRQLSGYQSFHQWMDEYCDESEPVRRFRFKHWTWIFEVATPACYTIEDESIFHLHPDGNVEVMRNRSLNQQVLCHCDDEPIEEETEEEDDEAVGELWTMSRFARVLAQNDAELIRLASEFVAFIEFEDEKYEAICCKLCMLPMFYFRTSREVETGLDPVTDSSGSVPALPPPIPLKSACRASTLVSSESELSEQQPAFKPLEECSTGSSPSFVDELDHDEPCVSSSDTDSIETLTPLTSNISSTVATTLSTVSPSSSSQSTLRSTSYGELESSPSSNDSSGWCDKEVSRDQVPSYTQDVPPPETEAAPCSLKRSPAHRLAKKFSTLSLRRSSGNASKTDVSEPTAVSTKRQEPTWTYSQQVASARSGSGSFKGKLMDRLRRR